jgi:hypothetical protein
MVGDSTPRTAQEVIDQAVSENRSGERLLYAFAIVFVVLGIAIIAVGLWRHELAIAALGTLASALFWPAMDCARRTRKESVAIRLLEAPLSRADTAKDAAEMLREVFHDLFHEQHTLQRARNSGAQRSRKTQAIK